MPAVGQTGLRRGNSIATSWETVVGSRERHWGLDEGVAVEMERSRELKRCLGSRIDGHC